MLKSISDEIKKVALKNFPEECCGFIVNDHGTPKVIECKNVAIDKVNSFEIDNEEYLKVISAYQIFYVFHSHTLKDHCVGLSTGDIECCNIANIPYIVYNIIEDCFDEMFPEKYNKELKGQKFILGYQDCFSFVRLYFWQKHKTFIKNIERPADYIFTPKDIMAQKIKDVDNFYEVTGDYIKKEDVLVFKGRSNSLQHLAIYNDNNKILHHAWRQLSCEEDMGDIYSKIGVVLRKRV